MKFEPGDLIMFRFCRQTHKGTSVPNYLVDGLMLLVISVDERIDERSSSYDKMFRYMTPNGEKYVGFIDNYVLVSDATQYELSA
jgi:hypothetical protein